MTQTSITCKNCDALLTGKFCANCGQKSDIHAITLKYLIHEFFHALTHTDKGVLFLIKEMAYRPGHVAREYIEGKRQKYFNPLSFLVIVSAIFALVAMKSGYFEALNTRGGSQNYSRMPKETAMYMSQSMEIVVQHGKIISLIVIVPVLTFLTWLFFRGSKYNFAENLVLQALMIGQIHLGMVLLFIPVYLLFGYATQNNWVFQATFFIYMIVAYKQFFENNMFITILKTLLCQILFIVLFWALIFGFVYIKNQF